MDASSLPEPTVRSYLMRQHERLERLMADVVDGCQRGADVSSVWSSFRDALLAHLDAEDTALLPVLATKAPQPTRALHAEHRHLRDRTLALSGVVAAGGMSAERARSLMDELRAHASHEGDVVARFDAAEPLETRVELLAAMATRLSLRERRA